MTDLPSNSDAPPDSRRRLGALAPTNTPIPLGRRDRQTILVVGDLILACGAGALALWLGGLRSGWDWSTRDFSFELLAWLALLLPLWLALAWANGLYDLRRARDPWAALLLPAFVGAQLLIVWSLAYFVPPPWTIVRHVVVFFAAGTAVLAAAWRGFYSRILDRPAFRSRLLVVGAGASGRTLLAAIREHADHLIEVVGFSDDDPALEGQAVDGLPVLASRADLVAVSHELGVTEIALAVTHGLHQDLFAALMEAQEQGIAISPMPLLYESVTGRVPVEHVGEQWAVALPLDPPQTGGFYRLSRRLFDLAFALLGLLTLIILLPWVAPLIKLGSPGPVFFRQTRLGRGGRPFTLYKLRSMVVDAEPDGPVWASPNDPRVAGIGRWLRRTRLDELPQSINILRGEMSVIGPRPERPSLVAELAESIPFYRARHALRPGLTGWATVRQGYAGSSADALLKLQYDLYYIKHRSMLLDLRILLQTAAAVLRFSGR